MAHGKGRDHLKNVNSKVLVADLKRLPEGGRALRQAALANAKNPSLVQAG
jgi:hypothetical protein